MTFVGKILVIVIMAFALLFLGISVVTFSTAENWKGATDKARDEVKKQQSKNQEVTAQLDTARKELATAKTAHEAARKEMDNRIAALETDAKRLQDEISQSRTALEVAQQNAKSALDEATA